jgi:hypothetical protein
MVIILLLLLAEKSQDQVVGDKDKDSSCPALPLHM